MTNHPDRRGCGRAGRRPSDEAEPTIGREGKVNRRGESMNRWRPSTSDIAVIIPTRNRAAHLRETLPTVLGQTHANLEVLVVDDGSSDETPGLLREVCAADPRVSTLRNDTCQGATAARNRGAEATRAPLLAFNDDDARWAPDKLERQVATLRASPDTGAVYCGQQFHHVNGDVEATGTECPPPQGDPRDFIVQGSFVASSTLLVKRPIFVRVGGFDEQLPRLQDWDLVLRLAAVAKLECVPALLAEPQALAGGITDDREALLAAAHRLSEKYRSSAWLTRPQIARLHYVLGKFLLVEGWQAEARAMFAHARRGAPLSPWPWAGLLACMGGSRLARALRSLGRRRSLRRQEPSARPR